MGRKKIYKGEVKKLTVRIDADLKERMDKLDVNWNRFFNERAAEHVEKMELLSKSRKLTVETRQRLLNSFFESTSEAFKSGIDAGSHWAEVIADWDELARLRTKRKRCLETLDFDYVGRVIRGGDIRKADMFWLLLMPYAGEFDYKEIGGDWLRGFITGAVTVADEFYHQVEGKAAIKKNKKLERMNYFNKVKSKPLSKKTKKLDK